MQLSPKNHKIFPYKNNGRFYNYKNEKKPSLLSSFVTILIEQILNARKKEDINLKHLLDKSKILNYSKELNITWVGHSTFLIQVDNINILTDPVLDDIKIANFITCLKRMTPPGISLDNLPKIDFVLISHNHRDHLDKFSINFLYKNFNPIFLVPEGVKAWFTSCNINLVFEHTWWGQQKFGKLLFTFLPASHWSQRGLFDYNKSLWGSWMIESSNHTIYFAGDTAYAKHFEYIGREFKNIDIALMPIGPCEPRYWMKESHLSAEEAIQAFIDLKAKKFIPMHWATFAFGSDHLILPKERLLTCWSQLKLPKNQLELVKIGQCRTFEPTIDRADKPEVDPKFELSL